MLFFLKLLLKGIFLIVDVSPTTLVSTPTELPEEPYRRHLFLHYQRLNPSRFSYPVSEWKYFDLAFRDESLHSIKTTKVLDLQNILSCSEYPPRTLIIGAPGVGKTSLIFELCKRWRRGELLQQYRYVILLQASTPRICKAVNENDFVPPQYKDWVAPIRESDGREILFILEGYDELPEGQRSQDSIFHQLIQGEDLFSEASLIVTTRPWCVGEIAKFFPKENQLEILGFTPEGRQSCIAKCLKNDNVEDFCLRISRFPMIEGLIDIPFYLAILIEIYEEHKDIQVEGEFPNTLTKLYGALICTLILKFLKKSKSLPMPENRIPAGEFFKLPRKLYNSFLSLCRSSYESFVTQTPLELKGDVENFDLVVEHVDDRTNGKSSYYRFLHSSIGEYLTAYCISRMKSEDIKNFYLQGKNHRYALVLEFLSGFGCVPSNLFFVKPNMHNFYVFRELCEMNSPEIITAACKGLIKVYRTYPIPSPADMWCLGRVIGFSKCKWELGFTLRSLQNSHLEMLCKGVNSVGLPEGQIKKLSLALNYFDEEGAHSILGIQRRCLSTITEINLFGNHLSSAIIPSLCAALHNGAFCSLKKLILHKNKIALGDHKPIIEALILHAKCIEQISLSELRKDECQLILQGLKTLKSVEFWQLCPDSIEGVVDAIPQKASESSLERLEIHQSKIDEDCIKNLPAKLPFSKISYIVMSNCGINCETAILIAEAACKHKELHHLDLSDNIINDKGGKKLLMLEKWVDLGDSYSHNYFSKEICQCLKKRRHPSVANSTGGHRVKNVTDNTRKKVHRGHRRIH